MQNICLHIEYLLRYHECVIVPGIGAFLQSRRKAEFREADGMLRPARKEICFNGSITSDDGLLAHSLSRRESIGFEQARTLLAETIDSMQAALREDGELSFGRIGSLLMDSEGVISFKPCGRSQFTLPELKPAGAVDAPESETAGDIARNGYYTFRIPRRVIRYAAMFALVLMSALSLSMPSVDGGHKVDHASVVPLPIETKVEAPASEPAEAETPEMETPRYYLIVGASKSEVKCREFIAQHPDFELSQIESGTSTLIYVAASQERADLLPTMRDKDVKAEFGQTWIYDSAL